MNLEDPSVRAAMVAAVCLALWLTEAVPAFVPTLLLLAALPLCGHGVAEGLGWMADPVLALFFGGFALGEACAVHGIDRLIVGAASRFARGRARVLLLVVIGATAFLSMWMSNVAAAALMLASLRPVLAAADEDLRRALLIGVAVGANLGGMATPIGTGPNAIAIASMDPAPSFMAWMVLALPLTLLALAAGALIIVIRHGIGAEASTVEPEAPATLPDQRPRAVGFIAAGAVVLWLAEPLLGIPAAVVSLGVAALLFGSGLLPRQRLGQLDWSTLMLIAGGISLGRLLERAGWIGWLSELILGSQAPAALVLAGLVGVTAVMSALMSNTAIATVLIPVAMTVDPSRPGLAILIALAASFGMPFVVSTPINAMVVGVGARSRDLLVPGLLLMAGGCLALALTGPTVLTAFGY